MQNISTNEYIKKIPKAELHLHIEGTFEPELMFKIAKRNGIKIDYNSVEELRAAYNFNNLQEFLDIYYAGAKVLINEQDFYDLTWAYLERANADNVIHTEIMFDPQTHTERGISADIVVSGIYSAMKDAEQKFGITSKLILSILRHLPESSAYDAYEIYYNHKDKIDILGLDSSELGNPPSKFSDIYKRAFNHGLKLTAHAGEEGPSEYVWEALDILKVNRIDHGNRSMDDEKLVARLAKEQMPLTLCPLSNLKLCVIDDLKDYPLKEMIAKGLMCTLNSDDPAYFGGYLSQNYEDVANAIDLSKEDIYEGIENFHETYNRLFSGDKKGKLVLKVIED